MLVRLKHEKHGFHIVYTPTELKYCLERGWTEDVPEVPKDRNVISLKKGGKCQSAPIPNSRQP